MANIDFQELPVAPGLSGTEVVPIVQGGVTKRTDVQSIADLAIGPSGVSPGTYGDASNVAQITVNADGFVTNAVNVPILAGAGTVTSVALSAPAQFSVSGSPVTTSGTLNLSWHTQSANSILAGPTTGVAAAPTFRALVGADLPNPSPTSLGGVNSHASVSHQFLTQIGTDGSVSAAQPAASDLSNGVTGSGAVVLAVSPALTTPNLGTPSAVDLTNATNVPVNHATGTLDVTHGGTGQASLTAHGILLGEGTSGVNATAAMTDGQLLVGQTGADPLPKTLSGDATLAASGAITLATVATPGTATKITFNAKGLVTAGVQAAASDLSNGTTGSGAIVLATGPTISGATISGTVNVSGLSASSAVATDASKNLVSVTNTGSGNNVLATSPVLTTPNLGTPSTLVLTNATGLPLTSGVTGTLPIANGGTNATTQIGAWDSLSAQGTDVASASTINLTTATGPIVNLTGSTTVTAVTLAQGDWRLVKLTGAVPFTASSTLIVDGSTSIPYTGKAGDLLLFSGEAASVVRVYVLSPTADVWTPVATFATPGDLSVTYSTQVGVYARYGNIVVASFAIVTSSFTYTTASGAFTITGLPYTSVNISSAAFAGALTWQGITKANYTDMSTQINANSNLLFIRASGSGQTIQNLTTADIPSASSIAFRGTTMYISQ